MRGLVEGTTLPFTVIAARVGVCPDSVKKLRVRHGWTRPAGVRAARGGQRWGAFVPETVAEARALIEGSTLSMCTIAARTGVGRTTLGRWCKRHGWRRPAGAPTFLPGPRADGRSRPARYRRGPGRPYAADAVGRAHKLLTGSLLSQVEIARQIGVSHGWVGRLLRRRGWVRPAGYRNAAQSARGAETATEGDRRGLPYAPGVRREARALWELTLLPTALVAARLGCSPWTVNRWARIEGWERPRGRAGARQLRGFFGSRAWRGA